MKYGVQRLAARTRGSRGRDRLLLEQQRGVREKISNEKRVAAFSDLGWRLSAARSPREAAQILMDTADELFGWDACTFDLYSAEAGTVSTVLYVDTIDGKREDVSRQCLGTKPSAQTLEVIERGAQLILRPRRTEFEPGVVPFGDKARPSASLMLAPVRKDEQVIGILSVQSYTPKAYSEEELGTLQALADHCGGALERIRAEQEVCRLNAELERRGRERTPQIEASNKKIEKILSFVSPHFLGALRRSPR